MNLGSDSPGSSSAWSLDRSSFPPSPSPCSASSWPCPDLSGIPAGQGTVTAYQGTLVAVVANQTQLPGGGFAPDATVHMSDGPDAGHDVPAYLQGPGGTEDLTSFHPGDAVVVTYTPQPGAGPFIAVTDHWRLPQLGLLALLFAAAVVLVGGWRGTRALLALGLTVAVIVRVVLPLIVAGYPPVPLAVVAATAVTLLTILLTEGFSVASVAAILGTAAALALTGLLGAAATHFAQFTTVGAADLAQIQTSAGGAGLDLSGLLLAAFILGSLGILEDVTMTQAVVVEELSADGGASVRELYGRGLRVGRAHIAATVNTLFLAYVGAGLPLLVLLVVSQLPAGQVLNGETLAVEIVRALVGSVGIVAAVPMTTLVAAVLVRRRFERDPARESSSLADPLPSLIGGLVAIGVVAGLATLLVGPLGSPRQAQPTDRPLVVRVAESGGHRFGGAHGRAEWRALEPAADRRRRCPDARDERQHDARHGDRPDDRSDHDRLDDPDRHRRPVREQERGVVGRACRRGVSSRPTPARRPSRPARERRSCAAKRCPLAAPSKAGWR